MPKIDGEYICESPLEDIQVNSHILADLHVIHALPIKLIKLLLHFLVNIVFIRIG